VSKNAQPGWPLKPYAVDTVVERNNDEERFARIERMLEALQRDAFARDKASAALLLKILVRAAPEMAVSPAIVAFSGLSASRFVSASAHSFVSSPYRPLAAGASAT
jgi:hypothetical protein